MNLLNANYFYSLGSKDMLSVVGVETQGWVIRNTGLEGGFMCHFYYLTNFNAGT